MFKLQSGKNRKNQICLRLTNITLHYENISTSKYHAEGSV